MSPADFPSAPTCWSKSMHGGNPARIQRPALTHKVSTGLNSSSSGPTGRYNVTVSIILAKNSGWEDGGREPQAIECGSGWRPQWIDDFQSGKILFIVRYHYTFIRLGDRRDDHVERASRTALCGPLCHQSRPNEPSPFVEGEHPPSE